MVGELPGIVCYFSFTVVFDVKSFLCDSISYYVFGIGYVCLLCNCSVVLPIYWIYVSVGCVVFIVVVCFGVVCYTVCAGMAIVPGGYLYVYCFYCRVGFVCLSGLCTVVVMSYVTRIDPTWVADVGTGVIRFLVSLQKTRAAYPVLLWQVAKDRLQSVFDCFVSTILLVCPHDLLPMCCFFLLSNTPGSYLL